MAIGELRLLDFLDHDPRPTFIVDLSDPLCFPPVYGNPAFGNIHEEEVKNVFQRNPTVAYEDERARGAINFRNWVAFKEDSFDNALSKNCIDFGGHIWTRVHFEDHWCLISAIDQSPPPVTAVPRHSLSLADSSSLSISPCTHSPDHVQHSHDVLRHLDWTTEEEPTHLTSHLIFARCVRWEETALGPMTQWSTMLRSTANLIMQDPRPAVVFWGESLSMVQRSALYYQMSDDADP